MCHLKYIYRNNLIDKNDSYLTSCPPSWYDRNLQLQSLALPQCFLQRTITSRNNKVSHLQGLSRPELVEQELLTLPEHLSSPLVFSEVRSTRSLVLCVYFVDRCLPFCTFSFGHCIVCPSIYVF